MRYTLRMKQFTIVARLDELSQMLSKDVNKKLEESGFIRNDKHPDTVLVIGGDGTFLYAVHQYMDQLNDVRFFGIHTGTLGFYSDYKDEEILDFMNVLLQDKGKEEIYPVLQASVGSHKYYGLNEVRIENAARTQVMDVYINAGKFETFRGTGMCICTQLGSTAYNRSLGGAVIEEGLNLIEMAEISGIHHSRYRSLDAPFVLKADSILDFRSESFDGALLGVDSDVYPLDGAKHVEIKICQSKKVRVLRGKNVSYFRKLKTLF